MQKGEKEIALGNCLSLPVLDSVLEQPSAINEYRKLDGLILAVEAGSKNGALIEKTIQHLKKNDCNLIGVVITQIDKPLLNAYYFGWKHLSKSGRQELS